jgi:hypothetical protein
VARLYIVRRVLEKGAYDLVDYDSIPLSEPRNGLYLKKYYAKDHLCMSACILLYHTYCVSL